jgi:exodeoxyribonuclease VII large subunit
MSDDQLSWDGLFGAKPAAQDEPSTAQTPAGPTTPAKKSARAPRKSPMHESPPPKYSEQDWSSLGSGPLNKETATEIKASPRVRFEKRADTRPAMSASASEQVEKAPTEINTVRVAIETSTTVVDIPATQDPLATKSAEPNVMSVSDLNRSIKGLLEGEFPLVWLKAEISNFKAHTSGHFYFSLKDSKAQISAVMFRGFNSQLKFRPEDGMEVLVRGRVTVYEPRGNYQLFCEVMEPVGAGALQKAFEQLKSKLQKEGLFEPARKRALPPLPRHIGIVTSPTGAAIRDMLNVLGRRFKGAQITLVAAKVQGDQAPGEIIAAIQLINRLPDLDVLIVGRGGGSIEDLWAFNDEGVVRAIAASRVPVISAVGHEVDFTIADFVADLRAPTPSAAAELVVKNAADLQARVQEFEKSLRLSMRREWQRCNQRVQHLSQRLVDPQRRLQDASLRCDELIQRLESATFRYIQDSRLQIELLHQKLGSPQARVASEKRKVEALTTRLRTGVRTDLTRKQGRLQKNMAVLDSLSPLRVVERGYSLVTKDGEIIKDAALLQSGDSVQIRFAHGEAKATVDSIKK